MTSYINALNEVQRAAVTNTEGPVLVVAGPGSGKTRVLTFRIAYLLEKGAAPWEVLSLTFTNKAAREMKDRISKIVGDKGHQVWAGTFHSIFARLLRSDAERIGFPSNFTIYDTDDAKSLLTTIIKEKHLDNKMYNTNSVYGRISSAKNNLISPKGYEQNEELMQQDRAAKRPYIIEIYKEYMIRMKRSNAMDFDDLLYQFYILLHQNEDVLDKYRKRFRYILVDEFQDTNFLQYSILRKLIVYPNSPLNLCVVGDDAQSIYGFRGATIENILDFEKDFKQLKTFKLEQNYRSTHFIVEAANDVMAFNKKQIKKNIWTDKLGEHKIKVIKASSDTEEGKRVADMILEQKNRFHFSNSDIAILYRTNAQSRIFEEYLRRYNIHYKVFGGLSFYQRKEVKDLIAYLRLIVNPNDDEALRRVINYPRRGIGDTSIDKISQAAATQGKTMWDLLPFAEVGTAAKRAINDFITMMNVFKNKAQNTNAYETAYYVAKQSGIVDALKADTTEEGIQRIDNINALLDGIKDFVENDEIIDEATVPNKDLSTWLQSVVLLTDLTNENENDTDFITLMSVHSAKGLEYKSVFVVGMEEDLFPSFMSREALDGVDEERRLFYVAITRAEELLTLTYSASRYRNGQMRFNEPSRFLQEINSSVLDTPMPKAASIHSTQVPQTTKLVGNFATKKIQATNIGIDPKDFKPTPNEKIKAGDEVIHLKFGKGKVLEIDGGSDNRVATILFNEVDDPKKRIMLKFAKLQVV